MLNQALEKLRLVSGDRSRAGELAAIEERVEEITGELREVSDESSRVQEAEDRAARAEDRAARAEVRAERAEDRANMLQQANTGGDVEANAVIERAEARAQAAEQEAVRARAAAEEAERARAAAEQEAERARAAEQEAERARAAAEEAGRARAAGAAGAPGAPGAPAEAEGQEGCPSAGIPLFKSPAEKEAFDPNEYCKDGKIKKKYAIKTHTDRNRGCKEDALTRFQNIQNLCEDQTQWEDRIREDEAAKYDDIVKNYEAKVKEREDTIGTLTDEIRAAKARAEYAEAEIERMKAQAGGDAPSRDDMLEALSNAVVNNPVLDGVRRNQYQAGNPRARR